MPVPTGWHPGELAAQQARGYEDDVWGMWMNYEEGAPSFMEAFLSSLPFLSVTTLDAEGRPWTSLICNDGHTGFLQPSTQNKSRFKCTIRAAEGVPIRNHLLRLKEELILGIQPYDDAGDAKAHYQVAAVGVMLHNRRRNKLEGVIVDVAETPSSSSSEDRFVFDLEVTSTFGNCPKYINTRQLLPVEGHPQSTVSSGQGGGALPQEVLSVIAKADVLFLSSKHSGTANSYPADPSRAGNNIRGGPPGFLRTFWDEQSCNTCIVLPDWSGNRLMQSYGNMTSDPVAGITIPVWSNKCGKASDLLHLTCDALVLANEEASTVLRGVKGLVKLWPRSWTFVKGGMPLYAYLGDQLNSGGGVGWSPYNPPVRLLNAEKQSLILDSTGSAEQQQGPTATLVDVQIYSPAIATFTFQSDAPLPYSPGQHIILDCYQLLDTRVQLYSHMASFRGGEKDLNDDGTRSWTISYAARTDKNKAEQFEVTLRRKGRGGVTPNLFHQGQMLREALDANDHAAIGRTRAGILGIDGNCLLPLLPTITNKGELHDLHLSYLVSGIGLTPLLPHLTQLIQEDISEARVLAIMAVKWDEVEITRQLLTRALTRSAGKESKAKVHVQAFFLVGLPPGGEEGGKVEIKEKGGQETAQLPINVGLEVIIVNGKRLQTTSLTNIEETKDIPADDDDDGFVLPSSARKQLEQTDQVVVCAGIAFSRTAQEALKKANIDDSKIKHESFSF